jgi:hypothetical protein
MTDWFLHPYARNGKSLATMTGPRGGQRLIVETCDRVMRDTATNRNTRCSPPVAPRDHRWSSHGSGVVYSPRVVSRAERQRMEHNVVAQTLRWNTTQDDSIVTRLSPQAARLRDKMQARRA